MTAISSQRNEKLEVILMACKKVFLYLNMIYFEILLALCNSSKHKCYDGFNWPHSSTLCSMDPRIGEEPEIVRPGPNDTSMITQQPNHRSTDIWNGEMKYLVLTTTLIFIFSLTFSKFFQSCISSSNNCFNFDQFCKSQGHLIAMVTLKRWQKYRCWTIEWWILSSWRG